MPEQVIDRRALETAVGHAVVAARIAADAVAVPLRVLHQRAKARRIALVRHQIARPLPAEYVVGRIAPRRALVALVAGEEIQVQRRVVEQPAPPRLPAAREDFAEQLLAVGAAEKHVLARRVLVV